MKVESASIFFNFLQCTPNSILLKFNKIFPHFVVEVKFQSSSVGLIWMWRKCKADHLGVFSTTGNLDQAGFK